MDTNQVPMFVTQGKGEVHARVVRAMMHAMLDSRVDRNDRIVLSLVAKASTPDAEWVRRDNLFPEGIRFAACLKKLVDLGYLLVEMRDGAAHYALFQPVEVRHG